MTPHYKICMCTYNIICSTCDFKNCSYMML